MFCLLSSYLFCGKGNIKYHLLCQNFFPAGRVLNDLAKSAPEEYLKEKHLVECAADTSRLLDSHPRDQAAMKYTEGVLM